MCYKGDTNTALSVLEENGLILMGRTFSVLCAKSRRERQGKSPLLLVLKYASPTSRTGLGRSIRFVPLPSTQYRAMPFTFFHLTRLALH